MQQTTHPVGFSVAANFPNARAFQTWEGGCAYVAERDGEPYVIIDERTMADFIAGRDPEGLEFRVVQDAKPDNALPANPIRRNDAQQDASTLQDKEAALLIGDSAPDAF